MGRDVIIYVALLVTVLVAVVKEVKGDTSPAVDPGRTVLPDKVTESGTTTRVPEVNLALPGVPVEVSFEVEDVVYGWFHLAAGDGSLATFLASTSLDLDSTEVTGSSSTPSYPSHDPRDEKEIETLMRSEGDEKDDERDDERDDSFPLEASLGKTEADPTTSLEPWGTSTPNMASVSELMSGRKKCPDLTLMSPDGKLDPGTSDYSLECKMMSLAQVYRVSYTYKTPGRYQLVAYYQEQPSGTTIWRKVIQVEAREELQVVLGPDTFLALQEGSVTAYARLSFTPTPTPTPCPEGYAISWKWSFGDGNDEEEEICTNEEMEKDEEEKTMIREMERRVMRGIKDSGEEKEEEVMDNKAVDRIDDDNEGEVRDGKNNDESDGKVIKEENKEEIERQMINGKDNEEIDRIRGTGNYNKQRRDENQDNSELVDRSEWIEKQKDRSVGSQSIQAGSVDKEVDIATSGSVAGLPDEFSVSRTTTTTTIPTTAAATTIVSAMSSGNNNSKTPSITTIGSDNHNSKTMSITTNIGSDNHNYQTLSATTIGSDNHNYDTTTNLPSSITTTTTPTTTATTPTTTNTTTTTTTKPPSTTTIPTTPTATTTTTSMEDNKTTTTATTIVYHNYHHPGNYTFSVQILCGCLVITERSIIGAFTVILPIEDVQIRASPVIAAVNQQVTLTIVVIAGSDLNHFELDPVNLELEDGGGAKLLLQPTLIENGTWVAQVDYQYQHPGQYRPRVEVTNPLGRREAVLPTPVHVQRLPTKVTLRHNAYLAVVGQEVTFHALARGTDLRYDWHLPGNETLQNTGPRVTRVYLSTFTDTVNVTVYNAALDAHVPPISRPQFTSVVVVEVRLESVLLLVNNKTDNVVVQSRRRTLLEALVTPSEALDDAQFFWFIGTHTPDPHHIHSFSYYFSRSGELTVSVLVKNRVSSVRSSEVKVLVVERIEGVRGLANHDSVHSGEHRNYTVLVDHGSHINYTWTFGDISLPVVTHKSTVSHRYRFSGVHTITVRLTSPLGQHIVVRSRVFVLQDSLDCDTPKVLRFYPLDIAVQREFDGTRDILVEPELLRRCPIGSGPEYRWRIWNEDGKEVLISSSQPILNSPTLLLHPIYDLSFWKIHEGGQDANISSEFLPESVLQDGVYTAQLTIKERDTIVEASFNTSFGLVAIRLKVVFIDGTEREVDGQTNITLRVEVTTPTPNYTLKWDCQPVGHPDHSCFSHPDPWDSFTASTRVVDGFFSHLYHMWDNLHNRTSHYPTTTTGAPSGVNTTSYHLKEDMDGSSTPSGHTIPSFSTSQKGPAYSIWSHPHITPSGVTPPSFSSSQEGVRLSQLDKKFVETISIPVSSLRAPTERFLFKVSCHHHRMTSTDQQMVAVKTPRDDIGIRSHIRSAFPYGAARRMVFESECMSCTPEELKVLQYSWRLSLVYKVGSLGETTRSLTTANTDETELTLTRALRRHQTEKGFLLRPRDYLRVYNKTILRTTLPQVDEHGDSGGSSSLSYTEYLGAIDPEELVGLQHFSPRDLQKLPRPLTPDLVDRAREVERRWRGKSPYTGDGLRGTQPEGRQKRGVRQDVWTPPSSPEKKVSRSPPLPGVKLTGSGSRQVQEGGGGGGGQQKNHAGGRASPRTRQRRDAQNRQMKEEDRPSSAQTNKRREVVGRHSGAGNRGAAAMTDDAAPQEHSPVTSAKVTLHHHRLLHHAPYHNILSGQYGAGESEGGGLWHTRVGEGDGSVVSLPDPSWRQVEETAETVSQLEREDVRRVQQVDAGYLPPRHNDARGENPGNSGRNLQPREEIFTGRHKVDDKEARRAYTDREERARSQSNEWEAKVPQDFMEFRSDEIILLRGKEDEGDLERMKQHKEEEEKDTRLLREDPAGGLELWQINEGDHGGRDYQLGGGSKGRKKWRQMSVSGAGNDEAQDAARVTTEDPDDDKNLANTLTNSQVTERGVSGANKKSREDLRRTGVMEEVRVEEVTPLSTSSSTGNFLVDIAGGERQVSQLDAKTEKTLGVTEDELAAGDNDKVVNTLMLHDTSPNAPVNDRKIRSVGGEERSTLTPRHLHPHTGVPHSSSPPPAASPSQPTPPPFPSLETSSSITPSLQVDKEEEGQFSSTIDDHSGREDEWSGTAALHQSRREAVEAEENGEAVLVKEDKAVLTTEEEREREDKERTTGFEEEETVKGGAEKRRKNKKNKYKKLEERDKGQQIVNSEEGERTLSHQQEETGYKENGLTSEGIVKVRETEENDGVEGENDIGGVAEAGRLPHTTRHPTHHRHDSTHLPIRVAHSGLVPDGGTPITQSDQFLPDVASGVPWDTVASGAREGRPSSHTTRNTKVRGLRPVHYVPGGARSPHRALPSPPELGPVSVDASLNVLPGGPNTQPQGTRGPHPPYAAPLQAAAQFFHPPYVSLTHSPSGVLDYTEFKKLNAAKPTHHKILPQGTSESGRSIGNTRGKADVDRVKLTPPGEELSRGGGGTPSTHTTADGVGGSRYGVLGEREDGPPLRQRNRGRVSGAGTAQQQNRRPQQQTVGETERSGASGRGQGYGGVEVRTPPPANTRPRPPHILLPTEGQSSPVRGVDYGKKIKEFADTHQDVPNFGCRSENWELCRRKPPNAYITNTLDKTIGSSGDEQIMSTRFEDNPFVTDEAQITVYLFGQLLTSTGTRAPIVVLYTDLLITDSQYILYLDTFNPLTNNTGSASQLITFSPPPTVESCRVSPLPGRNGSWFSGTCDEVKGHYYPVLLEWSYHFLWRDVKTVFYYGARTSFDFTLPSGLESNDYKVYVSVKAIDGKGVSNKYPDVIELVVYPISRTGDGILSIFQEISTLENESPSLLLQQVRSLAWELNLIVTTEVTETIIDNILAIIFYASCQESLETVTDPTYKLGLQYLKTSQNDRRDIFVEVNLLKSCARDHLAEIIGELPIRDEMEVLQVLTALQIIVDAQEYISSHTYIRVFENMHMAAKRIWFSSSPELKDEVVQEFFILSSAMLDKQREIYDWNSTSVHLINSLINLLQEVMEADTRTRFLEEEPLVMSTDYLKFHGFLSDAENINRWNRSLPFLFEPDSIPSGVHLVQSLIHLQTPYNVTQDPITSEVINVCLQLSSDFVRRVKVKIKRSQLLMAAGYDFRRPGVLTPASLSVYEFEVTAQYDSMAFHILLQFTKILNSDYPVAAVLLICQSMQSLKEPLFKQELIATSEPSRVTLFIPPDTLAHGKKLLIIMDKNSYENNWARFNSSKISGADFLVSGWWSQCLVWGDNQWHAQNCTVIAEESSWDYTTCSCSSIYSVYGAQSITILDEESKMDVNELMLHETYLALYFMVFLLVVYFVFALALQTSDRHRLRRRNIWLRDNKPQHEWAYLLTIKTGTQWNAGTTAKVYAILHGTHGMSETRELQSKQTGQLFTRGALCTFILTTPEPLGDILKVQVWHDNSGGSESGWYVCETSVADLVLGARYAYPCYRWLSVQADDAKVEREITLESPTTFIQDFEHFLPQYASEHMLWTSLLTTSNTSKLYRLQRLTICLIVCLCMGTVSLSFVQMVNNEHTMMVPDMHIESLFYGAMIAMILLPVQWLLEMIFKMSNRLEEKEYNSKSVLDTLRATREIITFPQTMSDQEDSFEEEVYNPQSQVWRNLASWAQSVEITNTDAIHPVLLQNQEGMQVTQRSRSNADNDPRAPPVESEFRRNSVDPLATTAQLTTVPNIMNDNREAASTKKCSLTIFHFLSELRRSFSYILHFLAKNKKGKGKRRNTIEEEDGWDGDDGDDDDDDDENDELRMSSSMTFIFSQCVGWIVCCFFAAMCCMTLFVQGSGMSVDYGSLWAHIIYITLCCSMFVMQPLVIVIYTLYKVCMYRWFGSRGCISSCVTVPLDQVVAIWNRYQTVLLRQNYSGKNTNSEKLLEERQRTRDLRFAHPPSEQYLLKCREKELRREHVSSLLCSTVGHLLFLALLIIIASNSNIEESYKLNRAVYSALENGTCLDSARYEDACTSIGSNGDSCNTVENKNYMKFKHIHTKEDWWKWAYTELLALTYNTDKTYSTDCIFCDTNSIVIGMPRIRKYDIYSQECEASKVKIGNMSFADLLKVKTCFPDYIDEVPHLFSFRLDMDKEYEWDAHFLAVTYGLFGQYSYTPHKQSLSGSRFITILWLMILQGSDWLNENMTRAVVTDFTLYHPQTKLYTTVMLLAEFPSLSGAKTKTSAWSSHIERYSSDWSIVCMVAEIVLLAIAMYYLYHTTIYVYTCRFKIWKCFWGLLDVLMTVLSWSYMVCLMLRVQIAEDAMWQLRVAYFKKFVNLTGLATWDNILEALIGGMLTVHLLRCLCLMRYLPRLRRLGLILASAAKDVLCISFILGVMMICCICLGYLWFNQVLWECHSFAETLLTLFRITWAHLPFLTKVERESSGYVSFLGYLYYLVAYVLLYQVARALYIAAFLYARKKYVDKPGLEVKWKDITSYIRGRCRSLVHKVRRKKEEMVNQPKDNTPPDFYMTELDLQITQVMTRLDTMAETLGLVIDRVDDLIEEDQLAVLRTCDGVEVLKMTKDSSDNEAWQLEDEVTNSTFKMELEAMLKPLQSCGQDPMKEAGSKTLISSQVTSLEARNDSHKHQYETIFDTPMETSFNLDAFTDIASCQTEIEAFTRNWNLNSACYGQLKFGTKDDGGTMAKFLKDVSAASDESVTSYGKYGKTVSKLKVSPKLHPSHESLATNQYLYNNNSSTSETAGLCPAQSRVTTRQCTLGLQSAAQGTQLVQHETPMQSPLGISSRLCRTQTQGRGKGHVDVLDIVSLESDSEDESGC